MDVVKPDQDGRFLLDLLCNLHARQMTVPLLHLRKSHILLRQLQLRNRPHVLQLEHLSRTFGRKRQAHPTRLVLVPIDLGSPGHDQRLQLSLHSQLVGHVLLHEGTRRSFVQKRQSVERLAPRVHGDRNCPKDHPAVDLVRVAVNPLELPRSFLAVK
uniref:(northern house mosquito) hypothetical protein n=1 Tax=Culex pipiens TaxID=7175 RepID=A0A8D8BHV6_CULPI